MAVSSLEVSAFQDVMNAIRATPHPASREEVDEYHRPIIGVIDSGVIERPSLQHKMGHQALWISGHMAYENLPTLSLAAEDFSKQNGDGLSQRDRFNVWYALTYCRGVDNLFAHQVVADARQIARKYARSLEEFDFADTG